MIFLLCVKNDWRNLSSKKRKTMLNRAKDFYENNKKVLGKKARNKYRELYQKENM